MDHHKPGSQIEQNQPACHIHRKQIQNGDQCDHNGKQQFLSSLQVFLHDIQQKTQIHPRIQIAVVMKLKYRPAAERHDDGSRKPCGFILHKISEPEKGKHRRKAQ